jgi:signal transduction histidine kinase
VGRDITEALPLQDEAGARVSVELPTGSATTSTRGFLRRADGKRGAFVQIDVRALPGAGDEIETFVVDLSDLSTFKAAEDAKSAFLAGLSHELKTPLALIQGYAETLKVDEVRSDTALCDEALNVILDETDHLNQMVEQLLLASRVQSGTLTLDVDVVDVTGLVRRLVAEFGHTCSERTWVLEIEEDLPPITADPVRLREVLQNLLSNACRYSDSDSSVTVRATRSDGGVRIDVSDTGMGIPAEDHERIFERFVRLSDRGEGTGLGLYMSRAIVEAHGGTLTVESTPGQGSTFTVTLPAEPSGQQVVGGVSQSRGGREA